MTQFKILLFVFAICFTAFTTMGPTCKNISGDPFQPVDPIVTTYVAIGDSITQGWMSGDANYFTQPHAYPVLLAKQFQTHMAIPLMVVEPPATGSLPGCLEQDPAKRGGYHRMERTLIANNLGVAGLSIAFIAGQPDCNDDGVPDGTITGDVFNVKVTQGTDTNDPTNFLVTNGDIVQTVTSEASAVLSPHNPGSTVLDAALALKPTFITFWLGNNDALGSIGGTLGKNTIDNLSAIQEGGYTYTNITDLTPSNLFASVGAAKLDDGDRRGPTFYPIARMSTTANFQAAYTNAINQLSQSGAKIVVINIPYVTGTGFLMSWTEAKNFFIRYAGVSQQEIDDAWEGVPGSNKGFGGDPNAKIPFDVALAGLLLFKNLIAQNIPTQNALRILTTGRAVSTTTTSYGLFDWDVNNLTEAEANAINARIDEFNNHIKNTADGNNNIIMLDAKSIFENIRSNGAEVTDEKGNVITTYLGFPVRKLSRVYPGAGDPSSTDGSQTNGGIFSLDGVHPGPTAHGIIANAILDLVNTSTANGGFGIPVSRTSLFDIWKDDPFVDHDNDGRVRGFDFTKTSEKIGEKVILRDSNDLNASVQ